MMRWSDHQQTLLAALGLRVWQPRSAPAPVPEAEPAHVVAALPAARPTAATPPAARPLPGGPAPVAHESPQRTPTAPTARESVRPLAPSRPAPAAAAPTVASAPHLPSAVPGKPAEASLLHLPQGQREAAIAHMGWAELREAVADCRACGLCESRKQTVFGVGNEQAEVMIVGEAPGEQEDLQGEPFVGPAGQLLDNMLRAVQLTRRLPTEGQPAAAQVFIANTLKCRPPRNRNPEPAEMQQCLPFLARQIELVRPRLLIASGRYAINALLGSAEAIGKLRGQVYRYRGVPVVVTYHPAYLLRQLPEKAKAWDDLCLALHALAQTPPR